MLDDGGPFAIGKLHSTTDLFAQRAGNVFVHTPQCGLSWQKAQQIKQESKRMD
jgi:hypothetical protein